MWFLFGEILLYLIVAVVLGLVVGWLLGRIGRSPAVVDGDEEPDADVSALAAQLAERDEEIEWLRSELAPFRTDDLKLVNGIGPVFERSLNAMGYTTFEHVAAWSREDIRDVAAEIDLFPDRIIRDQWVEQAAALALKKSGEESALVAGEESALVAGEGSALVAGEGTALVAGDDSALDVGQGTAVDDGSEEENSSEG